DVRYCVSDGSEAIETSAFDDDLFARRDGTDAIDVKGAGVRDIHDGIGVTQHPVISRGSESRIERLQNAVIQVNWAGEGVALIAQKQRARPVLGDAAVAHDESLETTRSATISDGKVLRTVDGDARGRQDAV